MKRRQIYLEEELDERLRTLAAAEGRSAADIIRQALGEFLDGHRSPGTRDPFLDIAGTFRGGPGDAATDHDRYMYTDARQRTKR
jgi:hypothetical protein